MDRGVEKRKVGLDILRILSMLMVITQHYVGKGGVLEAKSFSFTWYFGNFLNIICYPCVLLFVLITGYFISYEKNILVEKKIIKIWKIVFFYSIGISLMMLLFKFQISKTEILKSFFPILFRRWGFVNNYIFLIILSPAINIYLKNATEYNIKITILILTIIQCIIPYISMKDTFNTSYGNSIVWFIYLYIVAYFIRKNKIQNKFSKTKWGLIAILCVCISYLAKILIAIITLKIFGIVKYSGAFVGETPIINVILAICIFCIFLKITIEKNLLKIIFSNLGATAFSVYLVHEHPLLRYYLWEKLGVKFISNLSPCYQILHWLLCIISIYVCISFIEVFRKFLFRNCVLQVN